MNNQTQTQSTIANPVSVVDMVDLLNVNVSQIEDNSLASEIQHLVDNFDKEEFINNCKSYSELTIDELMNKVTTSPQNIFEFNVNSMYWLTVAYIGEQKEIYSEMFMEFNNILFHLDNLAGFRLSENISVA